MIKNERLKKFEVIFTNDDPDFYDEFKIYILGQNSNFWQISFTCPCGCGDVIHLNLLNDSYPYWKFHKTQKGITISPSIRRTKRCKSHFFIKNGKTKWVIYDDY